MHKIERLLPNVSAAPPTKRRLLGNVSQSKFPYGSSIWAKLISCEGCKLLLKVQRSSAHRVSSLYSTVSAVASQVIADLPPIDLLVLEKHEVYEENSSLGASPNYRQTARSNLIRKWQDRWDTDTAER